MNAIRRFGLLAVSTLAVVAVVLIGQLFPNTPAGELASVLDAGYAASALRLAVPIAFAALGGIFAERSGVINIGLEGLLIVGAFTGVAVAHWMIGESGASLGPGVVLLLVIAALLALAGAALDLLGDSRREMAIRGGGGVLATAVLAALTVALAGPTLAATWIAFYVAVLVSGAFSLLFAVVTIEYRADQVIAGLAVWLIALGAAPFASSVIWGSVNSPGVDTLGTWTVPLLSEIPTVGSVLFDAEPVVYFLLLATPVSWYVLAHTSFGYWVRASGQNPKALDTAGVDVRRVRYAAVLISGVFSGIGGAGLSLGRVGNFVGSGTTMVDGRGWIGITAMLFGNYNPFGAFGASLLFAALDALQFRLQQLNVAIPDSLIQSVPYVTVIVVLALVGRTRTPDAAGEHYEADED
ncbi:ABC transporter permease [Halolamina sp. CBA1230]|uniref:ABC transporter permease n=1 Tax=Halolamina sp. CBA1230 TaxID=1853690 RepID=UPI0009A220AB|nr:ABC transporter permease [Halolamina sp. CBA1230]QKY19334.1 ABC transporter permease [Halolamina sp. CBA1230]